MYSYTLRDYCFRYDVLCAQCLLNETLRVWERGHLLASVSFALTETGKSGKSFSLRSEHEVRRKVDKFHMDLTAGFKMMMMLLLYNVCKAC